MPEWKREIVSAFRSLGIAPDATQEEAAKAYKTQALKHHPDKNPGDPAATQRFQKVGAAWDICQRHYDDPSSSYVQEWNNGEDDDDLADPDDLAYFMFMFEEMLFERYSRQSGRDYRSRRGGGQSGPGFYFMTPFHFAGGYSPGYSPSGDSSRGYSGNAQLKQDDNGSNERNQARKKAEYEQRLREFEMEIEAEQREVQKRAMEKSKDENKRAMAYQQAFQAARSAKTSTVTSLVEEYGLDVNGPEKMPKSTAKKTDKPAKFQSLLHAACRSSDEGLILFLLDKGAIPDALNDAKLYPFHVAISCGNVAVVKFFLLRRVNGRFTPGCHPSKAAPDGRTPLQIAISSGKADMIALMTKEATVHDVERCWQQTDVPQFKEILSAKKGFVDPQTKELLGQEAERKLADERAREEQKAADERARVAEKNRVKEERAQKRAAEQLARQQEQEAVEQERRRAAELSRQQKEAEEAAHRKAELEARKKMAAEAKRRAEEEARVQADAKAAMQAAEAEAEAARQADEARARAEAQARQLAEDQERTRRQAEEETRLRKAAKVEAKRIQREAEAAAIRRRETEEEARRQAEALRIAAAENARLQEVAALEAERNRRVALEQQQLEAKRAETLRRLQGQAEEHRRQATARMHAEELDLSAKIGTEHIVPPPNAQRRKISKKIAPRDLSELSAEELQKRAAQSARDKARIAEEKRRKNQEASVLQRPETPERIRSNGWHAEDYIPPTPVSIPSPSQRRLPLNPPLVPRHTRPNVGARIIDTFGSPFAAMLGPEDIQTGAIPDDLFAVEQPVAAAPKESSPASSRGHGRGRGYRARGRGVFEGRGRGRRGDMGEARAE
ncbi:hypothetical protein DFH09DRAFT_1299873 [Mycena vulgaris]|nr:hypothetical protein DFH09DRAFT_1299873 [Mycena vulgaris]